MSDSFLNALIRTLGNEAVSVEPSVRAELSKDKCPRHLWEEEQNGAEFSRICAAAVKISKDNYPFSVSSLIHFAKKYDWKIIARGGGSGVCGALAPQWFNTVIADLTGLDDVFEINLADGYVVAGAGIMGSRLEEAVNYRGFTLGHSPASLAISTPGGWVATRSSGQFSCRFGTIEDLVLGIEVFTGDGQARWVEEKNGLKDFFRMEGTSGIITKVKMKIFRCLEFREFLVFSFPDVKTAVRVMALLFLFRFYLEEKGIFLNALRLYDALDFESISKPHQTDEETKDGNRKIMLYCPKITNWLAKFLGGPVMILSLEAEMERFLRPVCREIRAICLENEGREEPDEWGETWYNNRFKLKHEKAARLAKEGILVDTFDCAGSFERLPLIYEKIKSAAAELAVIGAHFGMDRQTPYIYFTFAAMAKLEERAELYGKIWSRILKACRQSGGFTTHHHGIGSLKAGPRNSFVSFAYGAEWLERAILAKQKYDPHILFNPGHIQ